MKIGLGVKTGTSLSLTPQLQQAIKLLQLSSLELEQEIQAQLEVNPLLERIDNDASQDALEQSESIDAIESTTDGATQTIDDIIESQSLDNTSVDTDWDDVYIHQSTPFDRPSADIDSRPQAAKTSLHSHLCEQLQLKHLSELDSIIAVHLLDYIDERGYLIEPLAEIIDSLNMELIYNGYQEIEPIELATVLKHIQACDPAGVGASDLKECLSIQLHKLQPEGYQNALKLLEAQDLLLTNQIQKLQKTTGMDIDQVQHAMQVLKGLEPYPGLEYGEQDDDYHIPDVVVKQTESGDWRVSLNEDTLPKVGINQDYAKLIKPRDTSEDNQYLKQHLSDAKLFIKGIQERNNSLLKVATAIVNRQQAFLRDGASAMQPLILKEIAEMVDLHESTVSRITTSKTILTPQGMYELKYFFSSHVSTAGGGECSSTAICAMIVEMIDNEDRKKPLSDNAIMKQLQSQGIDIARRTVAKYRESMNIGASTERKRML